MLRDPWLRALFVMALMPVACSNEVILPGAGGAGESTGASGVSSSSGSVGDASSSSSSGQGGDATNADILDPDEVYLAGTLQEGACYKDAIAHWSNPNQGVVGFDCYFDGNTAVVRPTDGRLVYTNTFEGSLREFHCDDGCLFDGSYPANPLANDVELPMSPVCSFNFEFLMSPEGVILHGCNDTEGNWYDEAGTVVWADPYDRLRHLGHDGLAISWQGNVVDLATSVSTPITGLPLQANIAAIRALPSGGFWLVTTDYTTGDTRLWEVGADGVASMVVGYAPLPSTLRPGGGGSGSGAPHLDASGALFEFGSAATFDDVIVRRDLSGGSSVVYDEANDPLVKVHISYLVTGP